MYRGRQELEREASNNSNNNTQRDPDRRQVAEVNTNTNNSNSNNDQSNSNNNEQEEEIDNSASGRFGSRGNKRQKRNVGRITSSARRIGKATTIDDPTDYDKRARAEMDSRADTVCGGCTFELYQDTGKVVDESIWHIARE